MAACRLHRVKQKTLMGESDQLCLTEESCLLITSLCKINALLEGSRCGGEGYVSDARAVDFQQGAERIGNLLP